MVGMPDLPSSVNTSYIAPTSTNDGENKGSGVQSSRSRTTSLSVDGVSKDVTHSPGKSISSSIKEAFSELKTFFNKLVGRQDSSRPHANNIQSDLRQNQLLSQTAPAEQRLSPPNGDDELSQQMQQNGILHVSADGSKRNITNDDLPPLLDLSSLK